jgi:hypothetical protein
MVEQRVVAMAEGYLPARGRLPASSGSKIDHPGTGRIKLGRRALEDKWAVEPYPDLRHHR